MLKVFATDVVVSKGFDNAPALKFSDDGESVRFRFGKKVYDTRAENNTRWINMTVKAFGSTCERIKKMQLQEGSYVNLMGRLDEDRWEDPQTHAQKSMPVIILDTIEYAYGGNGKAKEGQSTDASASGSQPYTGTNQASAPQSAAGQQGMPANFTGFEPVGTGSFFDIG